MYQYLETSKIRKGNMSRGEIAELNKVNTILVSQPEPKQRSPFIDLAKKFNIQVDFRPFIHVEGIDYKEVRKQRIDIESYGSIIFTSKNSVDHFFRIAEDARVKPPTSNKYFCTSEAIALYLQKFITYRKRKVFFGKRTLNDLSPALLKHKDDERFLLPTSDLGKPDFFTFLSKNGFDFKELHLFKTVSSDLSDLSDITYDMLVFFSPFSIRSLYENFPDFKQNTTRIAAYGNSTCKAVEDRGLTLNVKAPTKESLSMTGAIEIYLKSLNQ